jgi:hypothetical protein
MNEVARQRAAMMQAKSGVHGLVNGDWGAMMDIGGMGVMGS